MRQLLKRLTNAFYAVALMPINLVKVCVNLLRKSITQTVNKSTSLGAFSRSTKTPLFN